MRLMVALRRACDAVRPFGEGATAHGRFVDGLQRPSKGPHCRIQSPLLERPWRPTPGRCKRKAHPRRIVIWRVAFDLAGQAHANLQSVYTSVAVCFVLPVTTLAERPPLSIGLAYEWRWETIPGFIAEKHRIRVPTERSGSVESTTRKGPSNVIQVRGGWHFGILSNPSIRPSCIRNWSWFQGAAAGLGKAPCPIAIGFRPAND